ncbi:unnamed protein product [Sphagnum balticum]
MVHTLSHTEPLQCSADDMWEAVKDANVLLPTIGPDYFKKVFNLEGDGEPGTIRIIQLGPAIAGFSVGHIKERIDKIDEANKTFSVTVLEGEPRISSYSAEIKFVPVGDTSCEVVWIATYEPVGDMGPIEHIKQLVVHIFKTLERAVLSCKTLSHTEVGLAASPDAIWYMCKRHDESLPKYFPEFLLSSTFLKGHGEVGSIRAVKIGPALPHLDEVTERLDCIDDANKTFGYTVLEGNPGYHYFKATYKFVPGATAGTTDATWTSTYIPIGDMGPPEHIKQVSIKVIKAFLNAAKDNQLGQNRLLVTQAEAGAERSSA